MAEQWTQADVERAWLAGFMSSSEGGNGEYPYEGKADAELRGVARNYVKGIVERRIKRRAQHARG